MSVRYKFYSVGYHIIYKNLLFAAYQKKVFMRVILKALSSFFFYFYFFFYNKIKLILSKTKYFITEGHDSELTKYFKINVD